MIRSVLHGLCLSLPLMALGCGTDPREGNIESAIAYINDASAQVGAINDRVEKAIETGKGGKLNQQELREANSAIESLRDLGKKMQIVRQRSENAAQETTADEKDDFRKRYQSKVKGALENLEQERVALQKSLEQAEKMDPEGIRELRNQLTQAEGIFAVLARER